MMRILLALGCLIAACAPRPLEPFAFSERPASARGDSPPTFISLLDLPGLQMYADHKAHNESGVYIHPENARAISRDKFVGVHESGQLAIVSLSSAEVRLVPGYEGCSPISFSLPIFYCEHSLGGEVVRMSEVGSPHKELSHVDDGELNGLRGTINTAGPEWMESADGGLALIGSCDGKGRDSACVRQPTGAWKTVRASSTLLRAMVRYHPFAEMHELKGAPPVVLPTADGNLFALYTPKTELDRLAIARVDGHRSIRVIEPPPWFLDAYQQTSLSAEPNALRAWPIRRTETGGQEEVCGVEIGRDGAVKTACEQGKAWAVGRMGIKQSPAGDFAETIDAGRSWRPFELPQGWDAQTNHIACFAIGCVIGSYFRLGWGER